MNTYIPSAVPGSPAAPVAHGASGAPDSSAAAAAHTGRSIILWTADRTGTPLQPDPPDGKGPRPKQDASNAAARQIMFRLNEAGKQPPPADQLDLITDFERLIYALNHLYPHGEPTTEAKFRLYYRSVFGLAYLALEKENGFDVETARKQLDVIKRNLLNDEGPRVKSSHIKELLRWAAWISIPAVAAYVVLSHVQGGREFSGWLEDRLKELGADPAILANFMLLWIGCCLGVCLSYALRNPELTVEDLVTPESDFLTPAIRLALTGTLTMLLAIFAVLGIVDFSIASHKLSDIAKLDHQMLAFAAGVICGIGEKFLPSTVMTKAKGLVGGVK